MGHPVLLMFGIWLGEGVKHVFGLVIYGWMLPILIFITAIFLVISSLAVVASADAVAPGAGAAAAACVV